MPFRGAEDTEVDTSNLVTREEAHVAFVNQNGDRMEGDLNMNNHRIVNLPEPTRDSQPTTKLYVDTTLDTKISRSGDYMSGILNMTGNTIAGLPTPSVANDAANKSYIDTSLSTYFIFNPESTKLEVQFPVDMKGEKISNVSVPTAEHEVATKGYVDCKNRACGFRLRLNITRESYIVYVTVLAPVGTQDDQIIVLGSHANLLNIVRRPGSTSGSASPTVVTFRLTFKQGVYSVDMEAMIYLLPEPIKRVEQKKSFTVAFANSAGENIPVTIEYPETNSQNTEAQDTEEETIE